MSRNSAVRLLLGMLFLTVNARLVSAREPVDYVDCLIGTDSSRWMLYPGPSMPFGMVKLSPDNQDTNWKSGYEYSIENVAGFSHIHSWVMAGLLMQPCTGPLQTSPGSEGDPDAGYRSRIDKATEAAAPGYYAVTLKDYDVRVELTATERTGFHRYAFPKASPARVLIDLAIPAEYPYDVDWAWIHRENDREITGFSKQRTYDGFSEMTNEYTVFFVIRFDQPFTTFNGWRAPVADKATGGSVDPEVLRDAFQIHGRGDVGAFVEFDQPNGALVMAQVGISLVSIEQARLNLDTELAEFGWDFEKVRNHARETWNRLLSKIEVGGDNEDDKVKFYTNFYRSYAARTIWSDVNGKYVDMNEQIVTAQDPASPVFGCDAFWNTFWNLNQLWALVTPEVTNQWVKSLLEIYDRGGWLPKGPTGIEYSSIMVASHEVALINSAYQMGIRNYDVEKAYEAIRHVMTEPGRAHPGGGLVGNRNLKPYLELGYVPHGRGAERHHFGTDMEGPVSNTLEYAFDDWNVAQMAQALGKAADAAAFGKRANNWRNVFNPKTGFVQPRLASGAWYERGELKNKDRSDSWSGTGFVEGNAWQYTWFVPHDVNALVAVMGKDEFNERLNEGFEQSAKSNFNAEGDLFALYPVNHGNQPNMQAAYLFNYSGKPWLTQKWARAIMDQYYGKTPKDGWPGDEDQGQMGAWFVMSAMGLFQMDGGGSIHPIYEIGSPLFPRIVIHLDDRYYSGRDFVIEARDVSARNFYIQSAELNGKPLTRPWFYHRDLVGGGSLVLQMGPTPNRLWGAGDEDAPKP